MNNEKKTTPSTPNPAITEKAPPLPIKTTRNDGNKGTKKWAVEKENLNRSSAAFTQLSKSYFFGKTSKLPAKVDLTE